MDALFALIGIVVITGACLWAGLAALYLHDRRERERLTATSSERQAKLHLMDKMIEKGLPPGRFNGDF